MKKTIFEEMGGTYIRHGDYLIPALTLPKEEEQRVVGVWGQRHLRYLKEYRRLLYLNMLTSGRLNGYLADIEEQAQERFERTCRTDETGTRHYRTAKGGKCLGMDRKNEQYTSMCEGDCG